MVLLERSWPERSTGNTVAFLPSSLIIATASITETSPYATVDTSGLSTSRCKTLAPLAKQNIAANGRKIPKTRLPPSPSAAHLLIGAATLTSND